MLELCKQKAVWSEKDRFMRVVIYVGGSLVSATRLLGGVVVVWCQTVVWRVAHTQAHRAASGGR